MKRITAILFLALMPFAPAISAEPFSADEIKELALQAIRENPEIVLEAVAILERQQAETQAETQARVLTAEREVLERDPNAPVLGNSEGGVTIVEFFDYNCPYCKRAKPEVQALLAQDPNIRLVYREWPILGEGSVFAAKAALAARGQGKYEAFHWAMMGFNGRAEEANVLRIARGVGLDVEQLRRDMEAPEVAEHIQTSMRLAQALGFSGTPSFVIGNDLVGGFVEKAQLEAHVEGARGNLQ